MVNTDLLVFQGKPLKLLGTETRKDGTAVAKLGGHLVVFSGPDDPDLVGDFFTKDTDFGVLSDEGEVTLPAYYHHGLDETLGQQRIGTAKARIDDDGVWAEYQITLRSKYLERIAELAQKTIKTSLGDVPALGQSSGAVAHLVQVEPAGKSRWLKAWPLGEASPTPTPAEPRTSATPLKSLLSIKAESLNARLERIYRAFWDAFDGRGWVAETFEDYIVADFEGRYYRIGYTDSDGMITFADSPTWQRVERQVEWTAKFFNHWAEQQKGGALGDSLRTLRLQNLTIKAKLRGH